MRNIVVALAVVSAGLGLLRDTVGADGKGSLPPDLAHVPGKAVVVVSLRPGELWEHALAKGIRGKLGKDVAFLTDGITKGMGLPAAETERVTMVIPTINPSGPSTVMFVAANKPFDRAKLLARIVPNGEEKTHAGKKYVANERRAVVILDDKHYYLGTVGDIQSILDAAKVKPDAPIYPALELATRKHVGLVAINPEQIDKLSDEFPADAEPFKPLLKAKLAVLTLDAGAVLKANLRATFPGNAEATAAAKSVEIARKMAVEFIGQFKKNADKVPEWASILPIVNQASMELEKSKVVQDGTAVSAAVEVKLESKTIGPVLGEALAKVREAAARMQSQNNLKQIGLAMHNYAAVHGHFPPQAIYDKDGKALLSWRVLILPYIEQDALYREFKLNESWDSPHNKKLLAKMPQIYTIPNSKPKNDHGTFYQVFFGKGAAFEGKTGNTIASFTDGTSNTLLAATAEKDVPWSKPEDIPFDDTKDLPKLGNQSDKGFNVLFADGSVRYLSHTIDNNKLKALVTRMGGEVITNDD